jgi:hypothetical protein
MEPEDFMTADERSRLQKEYTRLQSAARRTERRLESIGAEWLAVANALNRLERGDADKVQHVK